MGDGTEENPYTREDVERLIKEHGDMVGGLNLSEKVFQKGIDLSELDLEKADLRYAQLERAKLQFADLEGANLYRVNLIEAILVGTNLKMAQLDDALLMRANLHHANLDKTSLKRANLSEADFDSTILGADFREATLWRVNLTDAEFPRDAHLEEVGWGDYILQEEEHGFFESAKETYHRLKIWYTEHGVPDIAAQFYYREKEMERKSASQRRDRIKMWFSWAFFGHGEGWKRILFWIAGCILFFTLIYFFIGTLTLDAFFNSLYYSAASFITLGYVSWIQETAGWMKGLGVFEAFVGFFMMTLLLVTFVRKWTR